MFHETPRFMSVLSIASLFVGALAGPVIAEPGVEAGRLVFGQSAAFKGPASALGQGMREGILASFEEANRAGGVHGRRLELVHYNDGYEPEKAIENTLQLVERDRVFALLGEVGTPTSKAAQPIATKLGVPFIGPLTGAAFLREATLGNVINLRASYGQETEAWIEYLAERLGLTRIAILYQDDSFGRAGLSGVLAALRRRNIGLAAEGTYKRNTTAVKRALLAIRKVDPEAVVIVGAYKPTAAFIRLARQLDLDPVFIAISFVGSRALADELGPEGEGVLITQVVPLPRNRTIPVVAQYQDALRARDPEAMFGFVSLEGYLVGRLVVAALNLLGPDVTRKGLLATIREMEAFDLGGITLSFSSDDNQGSDEVFFTRIERDGRFSAVQR